VHAPDARELTAGGVRYRLIAITREDGFLARAERADTGERFGIECAGASPAECLDRLVRWLAWQHEHAAALAALQGAERAYHRTLAGSAFADPSEGPTAIELQKESLEQVEAARTRLDEVRARRPE
jgi:hypothetical protein